MAAVAPVWVRGLKLCGPFDPGTPGVAPVWVRGLKQTHSRRTWFCRSRTRMGAWIETHPGGVDYLFIQSHPYGCVD